MTDRPTCETCPYWDKDGTCETGDEGFCRRTVPVPSLRELTDGDLSDGGHWPLTLNRAWCGEHPDFPAWIAATRPPAPEKPVPSVVESFDALRDAGGDAWDKIDDPEAFLREVRGE